MSMTRAGVILGTAAYMAPEQARGKPADKRADIWGFGMVLYEMLAGCRPFADGEGISDTLASVMKDQPDWANLPADTPPHVRSLLERCLRKDPKARLKDAETDSTRFVFTCPKAPNCPPIRIRRI